MSWLKGTLVVLIAVAAAVGCLVAISVGLLRPGSVRERSIAAELLAEANDDLELQNVRRNEVWLRREYLACPDRLPVMSRVSLQRVGVARLRCTSPAGNAVIRLDPPLVSTNWQAGLAGFFGVGLFLMFRRRTPEPSSS